VKTAVGVVALALACAVAAPAAAQAPPLSREQALSGMTAADTERRRQSAARLGELGTTADAPALLRALRDPDDVVRALAERGLWQVWSRSGDPEIDALFQTGVEQMSRGDGEDAIRTFSAIIARKPEFAEGWNKRATTYFLMGRYGESLRDCDEVVKRNPQHFGVLAGYGQIYLQMDQPERALEYFERALAVNPNLTQVEQVVAQLRRLLIEKRKGTI
jgi:tetratricopeptide (TPR) repeat protein